MGTISEAIVTFIQGYENIVIDTSHVKDGSDSYGLFKSPERNVQGFLDSEYEISEYYQFIVKQSSVSNTDRKTADEWLENLAYWVDDYSHNYAYPTLTGNRIITNIELTGCPYPMESTEDETLYQMSLKITYNREREEL